MKLSKLYSNKPELFEPVDFVPGLNVVMAEIRLPENRNKDTHNLGKTTLELLLNFCLLAKRKPDFFLFKHFDIFKEFKFFLEIELADASYVTVSRSVENASKISFKKHEANGQDFNTLSETEWDHSNIPFKRAVNMLDSLLDLRALNPWGFRKYLGYQLRSMKDFNDVFKISKFLGADSDWKPFLSHILGHNDQLVTQHYGKIDQINKKIMIEQVVMRELGGSVEEDINKIVGILLLKRQESEKKQKLLDTFDFRSQDKDHTKQLVDKIDENIAELNADRYSLTKNKKKITSSLKEDRILFDPDEAQLLFEQVGILFEGQIKKDFKQLIDFNRAITEERRGYLQEELGEIIAKSKKINTELNDLGKQRSDILAFLSDTDVFNKYKQFSDEMVSLRADIAALELKRTSLVRLQNLRNDIRTLKEKRDHLKELIQADLTMQHEDKKSRFSSIRLFFNQIVEEVIDRKAVLYVKQNKDGHLEFKAQILDESGNSTSAGLGNTYRKLLCIAFDLAVLHAYRDAKFSHFIFLDGVFESLDDRKKNNLLEVIRRYSGLGIQLIITLIDSDEPPHPEDGDAEVFSDDEIVLTLHDESEQGLLFKMNQW